MKKITISSLLLAITLVACQDPLPSSSNEPTSLPPSSQENPNGLLPLEPVEGCLEPRVETYWVCTWSDEFNGETLNKDNWNVEINGNGGGNNEAQFYLEENIAVEEGNLVITAKQETYLNRQYTSGRMNSRYKVSAKYGRVVFRAQMPAGRGTWAAVWMLPLFNRYGQWPNSGEIDILEYVGYDEDQVFAATHTSKFNHMTGNNPSFAKTVQQAEEEMVTYEMIWSPGEIRVAADGDFYGTFRYIPQFNQDVTYDEVFPFDQEFYFIINLAIGGSWGGVQGIDNSIFPTQMKVDYLRLYEYDYAIDTFDPPVVPVNVAASQLANTIHWNRDFIGTTVEYYLLYLDGQFHRFTENNQFTFNNLTDNQTYEVTVTAMDFLGRESAASSPISFTYQG
jgi:beta-glucanase (GH16 family)